MIRNLLVVMPLLLSSTVNANDQTLQQCVAIDNPAQRLACYDLLAGRQTGAKAASAADLAPSGQAAVPSLPTAPVSVPVVAGTDPAVAPPPPKVKDAEALFGLEHKQPQDEGAPSTLTLRIIEKHKDAYGKWVLTLENGQIWRQTDSMRFNFGNEQDLVEISRGAVGGFFIGEPERNKRFRAKRVK